MKKGAPKRQDRQAETLRAVKAWQANALHPLTCGNDSTHRPLKPKKSGDGVILECLDCDYVQKTIPRAVLNAAIVPPSPYDFEETVKRLLNVKPPKDTR